MVSLHHSSAKRVASFVLAGSILLCACSCKKKKKDQVPAKRDQVVSETDPFFETKEFDLSFPLDPEREVDSFQIETPTLLGDMIAAEYHVWYKMTPEDIKKQSELSDDESWAFFQSFSHTGKALFDMEGNFVRELVQEDGESSILGFQTAFSGADGKNYAIYNRADDGMHSYLCTMSETGEPDKGIKLDSYYTFSFESQFMVTKDGMILAGAPEAICIFRPDGSFVNDFRCDGCQGGFVVQDGKYYAKGSRNTDPENPFEVTEYIIEIDLEKGEAVGSEIKCANVYLLVPGRDSSYRLDTNGVKKVDLLDPSNDHYVMEWAQTDYDPGNLDFRNMQVVSDTEFIFFDHFVGSYDTTGEVKDEMKLVRLTRMDKNPYAGKPIIQMACYGTTSVMDYVVSYNTDPASENRIILHDYSQDVDPNWPPVDQSASAADTVYQAMISGNGPDILANFGSFSQFDKDDILVDLNPLIDAEDSTIKREDYYDNILRAAETDGKLYQVPLLYSIEGLMGNKDILGEPTNWDCGAFCEKMKTLPSDKRIFEEEQYKYFFPNLFSYSARNLIDYEKQKVNFDSDGFRDFLTLMKDYGEKGTAYTFSDSWDLYSSGTQVFIPATIQCLDDYARYMDIRKGNDAIYPMPSVGGSGLSADVKLTMAISKYSSHQEEAWEFIRFMMGKDEQVRLGSGVLFPIHKEALAICSQKRIEQHEELKKTLSENPNVALTYSITEKTAKAVEQLIERISSIRATDPDIMNIILEEAPGYFSGQRTVEEVSKTIQNRAQTVVNERG